MVELKCDKCGKDCGMNATAVRLQVIHNPCPAFLKDTGSPALSSSNESIQFLVCEDCAKEMGLPNLYTSYRDGKIAWRDDDEVTEDGEEDPLEL